MPFNPLFPSPPAAAAPRLIIHGRFGKTDGLSSFVTRSIYNRDWNNNVKILNQTLKPKITHNLESRDYDLRSKVFSLLAKNFQNKSQILKTIFLS